MGERVRASLGICYLTMGKGLEIEEGELGTVVAERPDVRALYAITWDSHPGARCWTACDVFDPVPS